MSEKELDEQLEFEMDDEDLEWLTTKLPEQKIQLKEDKFEQIIDRLEKESFKQVTRLFPVITHDTYYLGTRAYSLFFLIRVRSRKWGLALRLCGHVYNTLRDTHTPCTLRVLHVG